VTAETRATLSAAEINDLPDSAFAYIEPGGTKDAEGKTTPRGKRHFPVQDKAHAKDALDRMGTSPFGDKAKAAILAACKEFSVDVDESKLSARRAAFELRKRRRGSLIRQMERRNIPFARGQVEVRAKPDGTGGTSYTFEGYGAVFDTPFEMWDPWGDEYVEVVQQGAFTRTLAAAPDVPFLIGHNDAGIPLARTRSGTMQLSQDTHGLHVLVPAMDGANSEVRNLASAVDRGDLDEMSIGFVTMSQQWSPDWEQRNMLDLELHRGDVSAVALAANPATSGSTMITLGSRRPGERRTPTQPYTAHKGETNECSQCHSMNDDTASFCDQCGKAMQPASHVSNMAGVEDMTQQCGCGKWNSEDARYCGSCGQEMSTGNGGSPSYGGYWADGRPREQRAQDEIVDTSKQPDFNVATDDPAANGVASVKCPHTVKNGCGQMCPGGSKFCSNCGGSLYDGGGTLVVDDSGVVESDEGDAALLSLRLRLLELA
jgi:HK97 family phage prohead protease